MSNFYISKYNGFFSLKFHNRTDVKYNTIRSYQPASLFIFLIISFWIFLKFTFLLPCIKRDIYQINIYKLQIISVLYFWFHAKLLSIEPKKLMETSPTSRFVLAASRPIMSRQDFGLQFYIFAKSEMPQYTVSFISK